jgi:hypothetical protein
VDWVTSDKTRIETTSPLTLIADMPADMDFRCNGPNRDVALPLLATSPLPSNPDITQCDRHVSEGAVGLRKVSFEQLSRRRISCLQDCCHA